MRPDPRADRRRHRVLDHAARDGDVRGHGARRGRRGAAVGRLPDSRLPQDRAGRACRACRPPSIGFLMRKGRIPDRLVRHPGRPGRPRPTAISTRCRAGSRRSGPGPSWPTVRTGWPTPSTGRAITREVENKLSDALHERLTERFVDRRTSVLMRRLRENTSLETEIGKTGEVIVEGHVIGRLDGFTFAPDAAEAGLRRQGACRRAAQKALAGEIDARAEQACAGAGRAVRAGLRRHASAGPATRSASSSRPTTRCIRACASLPTSASPARRARRCRRGSISG